MPKQFVGKNIKISDSLDAAASLSLFHRKESGEFINRDRDPADIGANVPDSTVGKTLPPRIYPKSLMYNSGTTDKFLAVNRRPMDDILDRINKSTSVELHILNTARKNELIALADVNNQFNTNTPSPPRHSRSTGNLPTSPALLSAGQSALSPVPSATNSDSRCDNPAPLPSARGFFVTMFDDSEVDTLVKKVEETPRLVTK